MRLAEMMALRQVIGAGALVTVTERCPLSCAHCASAATLAGRQLDATALLRFLSTFTAKCRPEVLMLTGGEPLTRPRLVVEAARLVRSAGTRTAVLSGAFFAQGKGIPPSIREVARAVDHFSLSLDVFHEREVARENVFGALHDLLRSGVATSLHVVGTGPDDPYLAEVSEEVVARFGAAVPMLVSELRPIGRAAAWARRPALPDPTLVAPCAMAAWPVITTDGRVTACCNQAVVDGRTRPDHLSLGRIDTATWPAVLERAKNLPMLRMVRTVGPLHIASRTAEPPDDYCTTCHRLSDSPAATQWVAKADGPAGELLEAAAIRRGLAGGPAALLRRHGSGRYSHLVGSAEAADE
ncbi:hypothetical protein GCM10009765_12140 [Fodinicola feengrottensis]|uniref:Radical SAM core domain-containing protein n=1 Tax=Fodinicola feengrottensis TaxID=435914 RepID=A0ABN2G2C7_9ACTN